MGYTTEFEGKFTITPPLDLATLRTINDLSDDQPSGAPGGYCQWEPSEDGATLAWDGGEKFHDYTEWLAFIQNRVLKPTGRTLEGRVTWQGEEIGDIGILWIEDGQVKAKKLSAVDIILGKETTEATREQRISIVKAVCDWLGENDEFEDAAHAIRREYLAKL